MNIEVEYRLRNCPQNVGPHCKTYFGLYAYDTDTKKVSVPYPGKGMYRKVDIITPGNLTSPGSLRLYTYHGKVTTKAQGVYMAFRDQGACIAIQKVTISYNYCSERSGVLVRFPRAPAPSNGSHPVEGECTDANSVSDVKLSGLCLSSGKWKIADGMECHCKAGYELVNKSESALECKGLY